MRRVSFNFIDKSMPWSRFLGLLLIPVLLTVWIGCGQKAEQKKEGFVVAVSILPQKYFVRRIAGDHVTVNVMIPPGSSPATYSPTPRQMQQLSHAQIYFRIGQIPFETAWMANLQHTNPTMKVVDTSEGVPLFSMSDLIGEAVEDHHEEAHQHEGEDSHDHDHRGMDPHIWLSPSAVKIQLKHILDSLCALDESHKDIYTANYDGFVAEIDQLDRQLVSILSPLKGKRFMVFHPSWGYFARHYGLIQLPIEIEGKSPGPAALKHVIDIAKKEKIQVIFVQQQFDTHSAEAVAAEIGGKVVKLDPLAEEWLPNLKKIATSLKESLK